MRLRRAILFVKHLDAMAAFYRDALGLKLAPGKSSRGWVEFEDLAPHAIPQSIADSIKIEKPPAARSDSAIKLVFEVADLTAAHQRLAENGAVMREVRAWGCDGLDPEGNGFQIVANNQGDKLVFAYHNYQADKETEE